MHCRPEKKFIFWFLLICCDRSNGFGDMAIFWLFQIGGSRHLEFLKFEIFNSQARQDGRTVSPCQISWQLVKLLPRCGDFLISQDGGHHHLGLLNFLKLQTLKRAKLRHRAKFRGDQSNRCWDTAIFRFFQDGGCLPSWICDARV